MNAIHDAITSRQFALFESPTGTGKTLSIICSTLTWLLENRHIPQTVHENPDDGEPDWVVAQARSRDERESRDSFLRRVDIYNRRVTNARRKNSDRKRGRRVRSEMEEMFSESESEDEKRGKPPEKGVGGLRLIFATRTHSQLSQFLEEIRKTRFCGGEGEEGEMIKVGTFLNDEEVYQKLPLSIMLYGSRKQFCINEEVRNLSSTGAISERCRELTEGAASESRRKRTRARCEYKNPETEEILRDRALTQMHAIEDLTEMGRQLGACPYFATRSALDVGDVDVIGVPYSAVLHKPTRESLGLDIDENCVVVFDEAHNIVNTVRDLHACLITRPQLVCAIFALKRYVDRYRTRFSSTNLFRLRQLIIVCEGLLSLLRERTKGETSTDMKGRVVKPATILFDAGVDNINLYSLVTFIEEAGLCKKLRGFVDGGDGVEFDLDENKASQRGRTEQKESSVRSQRMAKQSVVALEGFLRSIADCAEYGRIAIYPYRITNEYRNADDSSLPLEVKARLKYFVVEPGALFSDCMSRARSVLMIGGTLSPRDAIKEQLLRNIGRQVVEFECDHVVSARNVMTRVCGISPGGCPLEFTYRTRQDLRVYDELGIAVERCISMVKDGVVMFFSSYDLMSKVMERWKTRGMLAKIERSKRVFMEQRGSNDAFAKYEKCIRNAKGAMLTAVMGGKLSEGINFSDELGRMVIMVGMPFANAMHIETGEVLSRLGSVRERGEHLENECLTVVNQCIGRAVRHRKDFATIVLMDVRYARARVMNKMPRFVKRDLSSVQTFQQLEHSVGEFFSRTR